MKSSRLIIPSFKEVNFVDSYFGNREDMIELKKFLKNTTINKIKLITEFDLPGYTVFLSQLYRNIIKPHLEIDATSIKKNVEYYFTLQYTEKDYTKLLSIIRYQFIIAKFNVNLLGKITKERSVVDISHLLFSRVHDTESIKTLVEKYVEELSVHIPLPPSKDEAETPMMIIVKNILIATLINYPGRCVGYGSFTAFNLDNTIHYNDIDVYHKDAFYYLVCLSAALDFILDVHTNVFSVPYITNHLCLRIDEKKLIDCVRLDENIMRCLKKVTINDMRFVSPDWQMLNNIRMHLDRPYVDPNLISKKYTVLLAHNYSLIQISPAEIMYEMHGNLVLIHLDRMTPKPRKFHKAIVVTGLSEEHFIEMFQQVEGKFSRRYHAFLREIFFESLKLKKSAVPRIDSERYLHEIISKYKKKKLLFISNFSSSIKFVDNTISLMNLQAFMATVTLYHLLHKLDATHLFKVLLNSLSLRDTNQEYHLIPRLKPKGRHIYIDKYNFKSVPMESTDAKEYLTYTEMLLSS